MLIYRYVDNKRISIEEKKKNKSYIVKIHKDTKSKSVKIIIMKNNITLLIHKSDLFGYEEIYNKKYEEQVSSIKENILNLIER